jgi:hypothetical protein
MDQVNNRAERASGKTELERALEKKEARRRRLAAASFPEKIAAVVKLQARFAPICRARGRQYRVWRLEPGVLPKSKG